MRSIDDERCGIAVIAKQGMEHRVNGRRLALARAADQMKVRLKGSCGMPELFTGLGNMAEKNVTHGCILSNVLREGLRVLLSS